MQSEVIGSLAEVVTHCVPPMTPVTILTRSMKYLYFLSNITKVSYMKDNRNLLIAIMSNFFMINESILGETMA